MAPLLGLEAPMPDLPEQSGSLTLHTGMSSDQVGALLPPGARQRLETLSLRREDAYRLIPESTLVQSVNAEKFAASHALKRMQASASEGGFSLPDDDLRVIVAKRNLATLGRTGYDRCPPSRGPRTRSRSPKDPSGDDGGVCAHSSPQSQMVAHRRRSRHRIGSPYC
jgi:hypothetical protein